MQKAGLYILLSGMSLGIISIIYFICLMLHIPFLASILLSVAAIFSLAYYLKDIATEKLTKEAIVLLACVIGIIAYKASYISQKYGVWDAWAMWNMHAKYLADAGSWKNLFLNTYAAHTDYPLLLPANIAFFNRLSNFHYTLLTPYVFHLFIALVIPVLIFLQTFKHNIVFAAIALIWFSMNVTYITIAVYQLADMLIAFFLLAAFIAVDNIYTDKKYAAIAAAMIGLCMWTKNEGILLSLLFIVFFYKELFTEKRYRYSLVGIIVPIIVLLIYKICFAPANDIVSGQGNSTFNKITDFSRYNIVFTKLRILIEKEFYWPSCLLGLHILIRTVNKKMPDKRILFVLSCCASYCVVYVITPLDLDWHLNTSFDRLLYQLIPVTIYALVMCYSKTVNFRSAFASNQ